MKTNSIAVCVSRLVAASALALPAAQALAAELAARPTLALAWTKRLLRSAEHGSLADQMELEAQLQAAAVLTHDHAEGVAAFLEKREARFEGR